MSMILPTVLVVDDTPSIVDVLRNILLPEYKVKVAISGEIALKVAEKEPRPDLILLDIVMPEMDGYEVCRRLKSNKGTAAIPVFFVTGTADDNDVAKGLSLGAAGFIMKPIESDKLLEAVRQAIPKI
ncbi:MAG: response regulator [Desulfuromonadales bacterium]